MADSIMKGQQFSTTVKIENQQQDLMNCLNNQRQNEELCDLIFKCQRRQFPAHRAILSVASEYFEKLVGKNFSEAHKKEIEIEGVNADILDIVLESIYGGQLSLNSNNIMDVSAACNYFLLHNILKKIKQFADETLDQEDHKPKFAYILSFRRLACQHDWSDIEHKCENIIQNKFQEIASLHAMEDVPCEEIITLLKREDIHSPDEDSFAAAVIRWITSDPEGRKVHLDDLMFYVRFPLLTPPTLAKIQKLKMFKESTQCQAWIQETLEFLLLTNNGQVIRKRAPDKLITDADGIKYRPRHLNSDPVIYNLVDGRDLRAYYPKYNTWYMLSVLKQPESGAILEITNVENSVFYIVFGKLEEPAHEIQQYNAQNNVWRNCKLPPEIFDLIVNIQGYLVAFSQSQNTFLCYHPENDEWVLLNPLTENKSFSELDQLRGFQGMKSCNNGYVRIFKMFRCATIYISVEESNYRQVKGFDEFDEEIGKDVMLAKVNCDMVLSESKILLTLQKECKTSITLNLPHGLFSWDFFNNCKVAIDTKLHKIFLLANILTDEIFLSSNTNRLIPFIEISYDCSKVNSKRVRGILTRSQELPAQSRNLAPLLFPATETMIMFTKEGVNNRLSI